MESILRFCILQVIKGRPVNKAMAIHLLVCDMNAL